MLNFAQGVITAATIVTSAGLGAGASLANAAASGASMRRRPAGQRLPVPNLLSNEMPKRTKRLDNNYLTFWFIISLDVLFALFLWLTQKRVLSCFLMLNN
jgi:hypothetical protein